MTSGSHGVQYVMTFWRPEVPILRGEGQLDGVGAEANSMGWRP